MLRTRLIAGPAAGFVLSAVFAVVLTLTNFAETLAEPLRVSPNMPARVTLRLPALPAPDASVHTYTERRPMVGVGERLHADSPEASSVRDFERRRRPPTGAAMGGSWLVYFLLALMLTTSLRTFSPGRGSLLRTQTGILSLTAIMLAVAKAMFLLTPLPAVLLPVSAVPLWCALYLDRRTALTVSVVVSLLAASLSFFDGTLLATYLSTSLVASVAMRDRKHSLGMLLAGSIGGLAAGLVLVGMETLLNRGFDPMADFAMPLESGILGAVVGGAVSGVLAFVFQGPAVLALGAVSRSRLIRLTDLDQPLLKKMQAEAPGSWEHSRMMANLAEGAAAAVGADALLTRVGAYYHDLGKTCQSKYFVENLQSGEVSPHKGLDPDVSADAIMAHVVEGTRILREGGIPEAVVEFAYTHHGTSIIEYFWHKTLEAGNPRDLDENFFRYPGMRPRTKETAILMLIDSIEAASRTVEPPTRENFDAMVQRIFFVKLRQGQLDESGLTLDELRTITGNITDTLCSAFHNRIKYPWQDRKEKGQEQLPIPGVATEEDVARAREPSTETATAAPDA